MRQADGGETAQSVCRKHNISEQANQCQFERDGFAFVHDVLSAAEIEIFAPIFSERLPADKLPPAYPMLASTGAKR